MYNFNVKKATEQCIQWIKDWFDTNGKDCKAIIGISGGVDSSVVAALCVKALGDNRVIGVYMPYFIEHPLSEKVEKLVRYLKLMLIGIPIKGAIDEILLDFIIDPSQQTKINLPPRIRMATLYAVSQTYNGRVANTSNLSETYIGYETRWGDSIGDFSPLACFTKHEVKEIGRYLGLPKDLVEAVPEDGLCGLTDEERFGFTYDVLDHYIRTGECKDKNIKERIDILHKSNLFKSKPIPKFEYAKSKQKDEFYKLSFEDIEEICRSVILPEGKIKTTVKYKDGTSTSVTLNDNADFNDEEKAIMWCLLKKTFKSKRGLERILYAMEDGCL